MSIVGIGLAVLVDLIVPALLLSRWIRLNRRNRGNDDSERGFWLAAGIYAAWMALWVVLGVIQTFQYEGVLTLVAVFFTLPLSAIPAIFNSNVMHYFFTTQEWADFGYLVVLPVFLVGTLLWAVLLPVAIRRLAQW